MCPVLVCNGSPLLGRADLSFAVPRYVVSGSAVVKHDGLGRSKVRGVKSAAFPSAGQELSASYVQTDVFMNRHRVKVGGIERDFQDSLLLINVEAPAQVGLELLD